MPPTKRRRSETEQRKLGKSTGKGGVADGLAVGNQTWQSAVHQAAGGAVSRKAMRDLKPTSFWAKYVSKRRPLVVTGGLDHDDFVKLADWTLERLETKAGSKHVAVEIRDSAEDSFGKGKRAKLLFADFLRRLKNDKAEMLYLTTQEAAEGEKEQLVAALQPPISCLSEDLPLQPGLTGNLIPQTLNLWLGSSTQGSSSGLHHDYHDNLYILLRGCKRFQLWSPDLAARMYPHGTISKIHRNGRIVYEGQGDILADGSHRGRKGLEGKTRGTGLDIGTAAVLSDADSDAELEAALDQEIAQLGQNSDTGSFDGGDDYESSASGEEAGQEGEEPPSFSRIDLARPSEAIAAEFPEFPGTASSLSCTLSQGEILYLPAGWSHNVTSMNGGRRSRGGDGADDSYHMAVNYWFHPPDNLDASRRGFEQPYTSNFWPRLWEQHLESQKELA